MTRQPAVAWIACIGLIAGHVYVPQPLEAQSHYLGEIKWVAFDLTPEGWADCDGETQSIAQNTALLALLGTFYGGNGQTTFALPDVRGRLVVHEGKGAGLDDRVLGQSGGEESHLLSEHELPAHSHAVSEHAHDISPVKVDIMASSGAATQTTAAGRILASPAPSGGGAKVTGVFAAGPADVSLAAGVAATAAAATDASAATTSAIGGDKPHPIMPAFLTLRCIIATKGAWPPRS